MVPLQASRVAGFDVRVVHEPVDNPVDRNV